MDEEQQYSNVKTDFHIAFLHLTQVLKLNGVSVEYYAKLMFMGEV